MTGPVTSPVTSSGESGQLAAASAPRTAVVVGTGLIGTSIALALREHGTQVWLSDADQASARLAADLGAGQVLQTGGLPAGPADIAVLAVPPGAVARCLEAAQRRELARCYTDVASVKALPLREAQELGCDLTSFVPGHPMSGRERSGPAAARADLFAGRPWVICPVEQTSPQSVTAVIALAQACGFLNHLREERVVDGRLDVDALDRDADLSGVREAAPDRGVGCPLEVGV